MKRKSRVRQTEREPEAQAEGSAERPALRKTIYPHKHTLAMTRETIGRLRAAAARIGRPLPDVMRDSMEAGLPLIQERAREARRKGD